MPGSGVVTRIANEVDMRAFTLLPALAIASVAAGCAGEVHYIQGTRVQDSDENRRIIGVVEQYRQAMERRDANALLAMASKNYWEDGGTPTGADDFGYDGLRDLLATRFQRVTDVRYSLHYMNVKRAGDRAFVDVLIDASYAIQTTRGPSRMDMRDQNEMVLVYDGRRWLFLSGM
jgi:ketosteroid isomerase-like protein